MKTKFILPAAFALTLHAFLLLGLTGKAPTIVPVPEVPAKPVEPPKTPGILEVDDPVRATGEEEDDARPEGRRAVAPRPVEIPPVHPPEGSISIPVLPPIKGDENIRTIPAGWELPRETRGDRIPRVINWTDLDSVPRARLQPSPVYPADLRASGLEGTVTVEFMVDEGGNAYNPVVLSATFPGFADAALRAVARWKFEPGRKDGRPVRFRLSVPVVFRIDPE
ncbi:MAG: TonB family protein [Opitutaceae bacterium]|nr:TonB family protein [Opitutaceae bacterium]